MTTEETLEKLLEDLRQERRDIDSELRRMADAYKAKFVEYRKVSQGISGIEDELRNLKERNE